MGWRDDEGCEEALVGVAKIDFVEIFSMVMDLKKVNLVGVECIEEEKDFRALLRDGELGWWRRGCGILVEIDIR